MNEIYSVIGKVVAYGSSLAAFAYVIFMFLGKNWIETKFAERLEAYKHSQERELERYRNQVNILFSRVTRIHEKEIDVLPEIWKKLQDALGYVARITSLVEFGPELDNMQQPALEEFLKNSRLNEQHKLTLMESGDKARYYMQIYGHNRRA